jgi:hypothetical protein
MLQDVQVLLDLLDSLGEVLSYMLFVHIHKMTVKSTLTVRHRLGHLGFGVELIAEMVAITPSVCHRFDAPSLFIVKASVGTLPLSLLLDSHWSGDENVGHARFHDCFLFKTVLVCHCRSISFEAGRDPLDVHGDTLLLIFRATVLFLRYRGSAP